MTANLWGYNGQSPGPTIECVEGDKRAHLRHQQAAGAHHDPLARRSCCRTAWTAWAASRSRTSRSGKTFVYEFEMKHSGTFMYHPHADEMVQMAMGMMGSLVVHPRDPKFNRGGPRLRLPPRRLRHRARRGDAEGGGDDGLQPVDLEQPRVSRASTRSWCGRTTACAIRIGNLTMTNHPIHMHGHKFSRGPAPTAAGCRRRRAGRRSRPTSRWGRCGRSSSSPTTRATGRSIATSRTTP